MKRLILVLLPLIWAATGFGGTSSERKFPIKEKQVEGFYFLYYEFKGPYQNAFKAFNSLLEYMKLQKIPAGEYSVGIYLDNPQRVKAENLRSEIGFMVKSRVKGNGKFRCKQIASFRAATTCYTKMEEIMGAWNALEQYVQKKGLTVAGPGFEFYKQRKGGFDAPCLMPIK